MRSVEPSLPHLSASDRCPDFQHPQDSSSSILVRLLAHIHMCWRSSLFLSLERHAVLSWEERGADWIALTLNLGTLHPQPVALDPDSNG